MTIDEFRKKDPIGQRPYGIGWIWARNDKG